MRTKIAPLVVAVLVVALTLAWPIAIAHAKINVSSLSAISANIGNVTAGTITGITITGATISGGTINIGSGDFTVSSAGVMHADIITGSTVAIDSIRITDLGAGGNKYVCADSSGNLYADSVAC